MKHTRAKRQLADRGPNPTSRHVWAIAAAATVALTGVQGYRLDGRAGHFIAMEAWHCPIQQQWAVDRLTDDVLVPILESLEREGFLLSFTQLSNARASHPTNVFLYEARGHQEFHAFRAELDRRVTIEVPDWSDVWEDICTGGSQAFYHVRRGSQGRSGA